MKENYFYKGQLYSVEPKHWPELKEKLDKGEIE